MYAFLRGKLIELSAEGSIVLDVNGVGYLVQLPTSTLLPPPGQEMLLYTSFIVRENAHSLYGFLDKQERNLFELLLSISGIGPKTALALLSHLSLSGLQGAITMGNIKLISAAPGIGKKTAERLILELKEKIMHFAPSSASSAAHHPKSQHYQEALCALIHLGFPPKTAETALDHALQTLAPSTDLPTLVAAALKLKGKRS